MLDANPESTDLPFMPDGSIQSLPAAAASPQPCEERRVVAIDVPGALVSLNPNFAHIMFVDMGRVDLSALAATPWPKGFPGDVPMVAILAGSKAVADCIAVQDRDIYDQYIAEKVAAERERCAMIAEQDGEDGGPGDICCDDCHKKSATQVAKRIRSGQDA